MARRVLTIAAALAAAILPAAAANTSAYTKIDLALCRSVPPPADDPLESGSWWCLGYAGMPVLVREGDLRFFVSYGPGAADEPAATQTLPSFNTIGGTLEWRLAPGRGGRPQAIGTILRFFTDPGDGGPKGQFLVLTKLGPPGQVCHIGTVNALLNKDANALAREVVDNAAADFDCTRDAVLEYGLAGDDAQE